MTIYLRDGQVIRIDEPNKDSAWLEADFSHPVGVTHIKQYDGNNGSHYTRLSIPNDIIRFITYDGEKYSPKLDSIFVPMTIDNPTKNKEVNTVSDLDILVREEHSIPDGVDTVEWCNENGLDYHTELFGAYFAAMKG